MYEDEIVSHDKRYRYSLLRAWDATADKGTTCIFIGLYPQPNPDSKQTQAYVDAGKRWGYKAVLILNSFALIADSTEPFRNRKKVPDGVVGLFNNGHLRQFSRGAPMVVVAWGSSGGIIDRDIRLLKMLRKAEGVTLHCVGKNKDGTPKSILRAEPDALPEVF